jgi:hypothetical protein
MKISKKFAKCGYLKKAMNTKRWLPCWKMENAKNDRNGHKMKKRSKNVKSPLLLMNGPSGVLGFGMACANNGVLGC